VPPALAGNARLAAAVRDSGLIWGGPDADVLERLGGDGVEPASERGFLAWVTPDGLRYVTPVHRDRAAGIARVSWTPERPAELPPAAKRLVDVGWRGLVTVGIAPDGELAEVAAGFSLDIAVLERAHGVSAVELALRSAAAPRARAAQPSSVEPRAAVAVQLRSTLPPGRAGTVTGRLPGTGRATAAGGVEVVAISGYEPGDRLDGWYDALLSTVSAGAAELAAAAEAAGRMLGELPEVGVPHDGAEVRAVVDGLAAGRAVPQP
jgi:biotin carboxylase